MFRSEKSFSVVLFLILSSYFCTSSIALDVSGYLGIETRRFPEPPRSSLQSRHSESALGFIEAYHDYSDGEQRIAASLFIREDTEDENRSHTDIRELYWWKNLDQLEVYAGIRKVFWGVTESAHLVDIINQTDFVENIDGEDKLGQPMLQIVSARDWGTLEAFVMPYFRPQKFVGVKGRLRPSLTISDTPLYQRRKEKNATDFATRFSHYYGIFDVGISYFSGTRRQPVFLPSVDPRGNFALQPYYPKIEQFGLSAQATIEAWLFKVESISRHEREYGRNSASVLGFEYTLYTVFKTNADLGVVVEYQFDDAIGVRESISQNDLVFGVRYALNDLNGSEFLFLTSYDLEYNSRFFSAEISRRITENWKFELEARVFSNSNDDSPEFDFRDDDYLQFELRRYF